MLADVWRTEKKNCASLSKNFKDNRQAKVAAKDMAMLKTGAVSKSVIKKFCQCAAINEASDVARDKNSKNPDSAVAERKVLKEKTKVADETVNPNAKKGNLIFKIKEFLANRILSIVLSNNSLGGSSWLILANKFS